MRFNLSPPRSPQLPCFLAGTLVSTPAGSRRIEEILSGDRVWGYDLRSGEWRDCMVSYHSSLAYDDLVVTVRARQVAGLSESGVGDESVASSGAEVRSTYHHPYWVVSGKDLDQRPTPDQLGEQLASVPGVLGRWVDAGDLRVGDVLVSRSGGQSTVESVTTEHTPTTVYHIYVEDVHNYAVGELEWLVHNAHRDNLGQLHGADGRYAYDGGPVGGGLTRPSLRAGLRDAVDEAAGGRNSLGHFTDADGNVINTHYGHKKGFENRRILAAGQQLGLNQGQLNDFVNSRPGYFEIQEAAENLSHAGELPGVDRLEDILTDMRNFFDL